MRTGVILVLVGFLCVGAAGFWLGKQHSSCRVLVVDARRLADEKKQELIREFERTGGKNSEDLQEEYRRYLTRLENILDDYSKGKNVILLRREAVIGGDFVDITREVKDRLRGGIEKTGG